MDERVDLDSILDGEAPVERVPAPVVEAPEVKAEASVVEPAGGKEDAGPPPVSAETKDQPYVPRKALEDERRKRQELQDKLEQLTKQVQPIQSQPQMQHQQPVHQVAEQFPPRPDPHENPIGAIEWDRAVMQHHLYETRVNFSYELMHKEPNYNEYVELFGEAVRRDPSLQMQIARHPLPAKFAYEMGKQLAFIKDVGTDPAAYEARLRQKWLEEQNQSQGAPAQAAPSPSVQAPKSLASTPSAQPRRSNGQFAERADLSDILGG